jgi:hypothetical protein
MKSSVCWAITSCSPLKFNRYYEEITRLGLRGGRVSQERNIHSSLWFMLWLILNPEDGGKIFLRNIGAFTIDCKEMEFLTNRRVVLGYEMPRRTQF